MLEGLIQNGRPYQLGISKATARNQLRVLFAKTGTDRPGELVALLSRLRGATPNVPQRREGSRRKRPLQGCPQIAAKQAVTDVIYFAPRNTIARVGVIEAILQT